MASQQLIIELTPIGFNQILVQVEGGTEWSFPITYEPVAGTELAEVANVAVGGTITALEQGTQFITGTGSSVSLNVILGSSLGVEFLYNPFNKIFPIGTVWFRGPGNGGTFQIAGTSEEAHWVIDVDVQLLPDPISPPPFALIKLVYDKTHWPVPLGSSSHKFSGKIVRFEVQDFQANNGSIQIVYTLIPVR